MWLRNRRNVFLRSAVGTLALVLVSLCPLSAHGAGPTLAEFDAEGVEAATDGGHNWLTWDVELNGIRNSWETAVFERILNDNAHINHAVTQAAWDQAFALIQIQSPSSPTTWRILAAGIIGDTLLAVQIEQTVRRTNPSSTIDFTDYTQLDTIYGGGGDADGDGFTNLEEYLAVINSGGTRTDFADAATDASIVPPPAPVGPPGGAFKEPVISTLGGATFAVDVVGTLAYMGLGIGLQIVDLSVPATPTLRDFIPVGNLVTSVSAAGGMAFVGDNGNMLTVVDVSDPDNLRIVATLETQGSLMDTFLDGNHLFVADAAAGLAIIDIADPGNPVEVGRVITPGQADSIKLVGSLAYIVAGSGGLYIVDVSDVTSPVILSRTRMQPVAIGSTTAYRLYVDSGLAYITVGEQTLEIIDVTDPIAPTSVISFTFAQPLNPRGIFVRGTDAFVTGFDGLHVLDVSNPAAPVERITPVIFSPPSTQLEVFGDTAYIMPYTPQMDIVDISDVLNPTLISTVRTLGIARDVVVGGDILLVGEFQFIAESSGAIWPLDISDPAVPILGTPTVLDMPGAQPTAFTGNVDFGYLALEFVDLVIFDFNTGLTRGIFNPPGDVVRDITFSGAYVYLAGGVDGLRIVDVADPDNPVQVALFDTPGEAHGVFLDGNLIYVADWTSGLRIVDVTNPAAPVEIGFVDTPGKSQKVFVEGSHAYVADREGGLRIIDVSNPAAPFEAAVAETGGVALDVTIADGLAYLGDTEGLRILDITNPLSPTTQAFIKIPKTEILELLIQNTENLDGGGVWDVAVANGVAYAAAAHAGLFILPIPPLSPQLDPLPFFVDADSITITGDALGGAFVVIGGGKVPVFQQLAVGQSAFSISVPLKQEAVNELSVVTISEFGLRSLANTHTLVEGIAFPDTVQTVTSLAITPDPAPIVNFNASLAFAATATFSDASMADVTEFILWEDLANNELITQGGLYVNTEVGSAQVRAFVAAVFSNTVTVTDGIKSTKAIDEIVAGRVFDQLTGVGLGFPTFTSFVRGFPLGSSTVTSLAQILNPEGNYAFLAALGNHDFRGTSDGYRPLGILNQRLDADAPLELDFALRQNDTEPPLLSFIEPVDGQLSGIPQIAITAVVFDVLSEISIAELIVNATPISILDGVAPEGIYRNVWPLLQGVNTFQLRAVDTEGNESLSPQITITHDASPLELQSATAPKNTELVVTFNKDVPGGDALLANRYIITNSLSLPLAVTNVQRLSANSVLLTTAPQVNGEIYILTAHGINDAFGIAIRVIITVNFMGSPLSAADTDGDGMDDLWETDNGLNVGANDAAGDPDVDLLTNITEFSLRTDPQNPDTDGDTLTDGAEVNTHFTNPLLQDTDLDGMPDDYEVAKGLDPLTDDADDDADGDKLFNLDEFRYGTEPQNPDTDGDTLTDGDEINIFGTNPLVPDTDGDGLDDDVEIALGFDPIRDSSVKLAITLPADGSTIRGDEVTLETTAISGRTVDIASARFQIRPSGPGAFSNITPIAGESNPVTQPPFLLHWNADALALGDYDLHVIATSDAGLVDPAPQFTTLTVSAAGTFVETTLGGVHTLTAPVVIGADNDLIASDTVGAATVRVRIPATALTQNTVLTAALMDTASLTIVLGPRQVLTNIAIELTLASGQANFANGQLATIQVTYPDTNNDGFLDGTTLNEEFLELRFLNPGTNALDKLVTSSVDKVANTVTAQTTHFSTFVLIAVIPAPPLVIASPTALLEGFEALTYSETISAVGGQAPYTWTLTVGILPPGLSLVGDTITGFTPQPGIFGFGVKVTDSQDPPVSETKSLSINVKGGDFVPPRIDSALAVSDTQVLVRFSEPMTDNANILNPANYSFAPPLTVTGAPTLSSIVLFIPVATVNPTTTYTLTVNSGAGAPTDIAGNSLNPAANTAVFTGITPLPAAKIIWILPIILIIALATLLRRSRRRA